MISLLFTALTHSQQRGGVWFWLAVTIVSQLAINIGFWLMGYSKRIIYILASKWSSLNFLKQLSTIDIHSFYDTDLRNMINKLDNGHGRQISVATGNTLELVYGVVRALAIVVVVATIAWWIAPFLLIFLIPSLIAESKTAKAGWFVWDEKGDERHVFWGLAYLIARPNSQLEIRALQAKDALLKVIDGMITKFQIKQRTILRKANKIIAPSKIFEVLGIALTEVWLIFRLLYQHSLSISSYIFYSGLIARINGSLNTVISSYANMQEALLYAGDFYAFLQIKPTIVQDDNGIELSKKKVPKIEFKNVWFKYPGTERWIFENLSFVIDPGEHIALIGENGAGKTTLVKLLLRFYDVNKGSIEISGTNLRSLSLSDWYTQLGTLFQSFNAYPLNIKQNITVGIQGQLNKDQFNKALTQSGVDDIVKNLPYGTETVLDSSFKKGIEPSGGQWQRVALARAFYRNPNVLILDEPTSAIDAKAEYTIFNNIFKQQATKTALIISHRFSTVRRASRIIVIEKGKIVEEGSHTELMKNTDGLYHEMFEKQAEGYR